jgi:hypothetical protein
LGGALPALAAVSNASVRSLDDLLDLALESGGPGRLVLDADATSREDLGLVRRILARHGQISLVVVGDDAGERTARVLLALPRSRFVPWPPDLVDLREIASDPSAPAAAEAPSIERAPAAQVAPALDLRAEVAALADISQRLALAFGALRESGRTDGETEATLAELRRLERFTRTLSYRISPPARTDATFDIVALIEEEVAALTVRGRKGPRFLARATQETRGTGELAVRGDRTAAQTAVQSLLRLGQACAASGDVIRVVYGPLGEREFGLSIDFSSGPLAGSTAAQLRDAAHLRERVPDLGLNEIAAAEAVIASLGGSLSLAPADAATIGLQVRLPVERLPAAPVKPIAASGRARGNDPFA